MSHPHPRFTLRQLGPAMGRAAGPEMVRAAVGAFIGVLLLELLIALSPLGRQLGVYMLAPFGATSFLLFAVPNSPLAQPWSAIVGNGVAAVAGVAATLWLPDPIWRAAAAIGGAIALMHLCRALHPPGGAVALTAALAPDAIQDLGFLFVLTPVMLGTVILALLAAAYASLTGRRYPFRQIDEPHVPEMDEEPHRDPLGLSRDELADLISDFRQAPNIGVEDLARLIAAAEDRAASMRLGNLTCGDVMTPKPVTVDVLTSLDQIGRLFADLGYTALPVTDGDQHFRGVIFQIHLIRLAVEQAERASHPRSLRAVMGRILGQGTTLYAQDIMRADGPRLTVNDPAIALMPLLAEGLREAVPILDGGRIVGIVTRTDLLAHLEKELVRRV
ncbi:HPP family protein [Paracoccus sp. (in: a-proteobacteria)]|uniref:HPP family protein n=1 Tax=Paracoccus sp. TaxID=267 RepID=UPI00289CA1A2|nr:HPP family protein [Paracoccus sp. (in: a-proteobacteria)]